MSTIDSCVLDAMISRLTKKHHYDLISPDSPALPVLIPLAIEGGERAVMDSWRWLSGEVLALQDTPELVWTGC